MKIEREGIATDTITGECAWVEIRTDDDGIVRCYTNGEHDGYEYPNVDACLDDISFSLIDGTSPQIEIEWGEA